VEHAQRVQRGEVVIGREFLGLMRAPRREMVQEASRNDVFAVEKDVGKDTCQQGEQEDSL
jgi:hypothetical protein